MSKKHEPIEASNLTPAQPTWGHDNPRPEANDPIPETPTEALRLSRLGLENAAEIMRSSVNVLRRAARAKLWTEDDAMLFLSLERAAFTLAHAVAVHRFRLLSTGDIVGSFSGPHIARYARAVAEGTEEVPESATDDQPDIRELAENLRGWIDNEVADLEEDDPRPFVKDNARRWIVATYLGVIAGELVDECGFAGLMLAFQAAGDACHEHATSLAVDLGKGAPSVDEN